MRLVDSNLDLSATDLSHFLSCRHRTALEMQAAAGILDRPYFDNPLLELLFQRGADHEKAHVASLRAAGRQVIDLTPITNRSKLVEATTAAMRAGTDVIVQGGLQHQQWFGKPDLLQRIETASALGNWSYEIADTKLAEETKAGAILQLGLYSEMLAKVQGLVPEFFHVVTPDADDPVRSYRVNDYSAYFRLVRDQLAATVARSAADIAAEYYPDPVEHCQICPWSGPCDDKRHADDHLSLVANISRNQRRELEAHGITTLAGLGRLPLPIPFKPDRGSMESFARVREQARVQLDSRGKIPPLHELRDFVAGEGLCRLPEPSPGDIFLDLEGDQVAVEGGREYLFGLVTIAPDGSPAYRCFWGLDDHEERASFEAVIDLIVRTVDAYPDMHVYHYAPYEMTQFKRLMGRYATRESEMDAMLRAGRFVDVYAVVRQGLRIGVEGYSIKDIEPAYGFTRVVPLGDARRDLRAFEYALATDTLDGISPDALATVEGYNRDDCVSTLRLRDWLEVVRSEAIRTGMDIPRPVLQPPEPTEEVGERQKRVQELRARLLSGMDTAPLPDTPEHARWLLACMLDYHRRESKADWWKFFELCDSTDETLLDEQDAVSGLVFRERVEVVLNKRSGKPTGSVVDRYGYPPQEMEVRRKAVLNHRDKARFGDVVAVDRVGRTIDVKKGKTQAELHPSAVFAYSHVGTDGIEDALLAIGESVASGSGVAHANGIARALLQREAPRLTTGVFQQSDDVIASDLAIATVAHLDRTVLAIQGPPGSGKTYTGARMICALVAQGKRVGVLGPSHKVIANLLIAVRDAAGELGQTVRIAQKCGDDEASPLPAGFTPVSSNEEAAGLLADGDVDLIGGTAWLWSSSHMVNSVDVIVVDEAGQVSLANAVAVSKAAECMVLLGDPQQLEQPVKGTHPDGVAASSLQHLLGVHRTIPPGKGIFLPVTWRLAPAICDFTSELFYESRLVPRPALANQVLDGIAGLSGSGLWRVDVAHDSRSSSSDEEVEVVKSLVERLTAPGASWISQGGVTAQLTLNDVLVVSPFNAQVSRLIDRLPKGARVGTVDKFQGQEAPVVIYTMATSRPEDAPRGMEFLYSLNRLNVATSRARCAVVVVGNPRLFEPQCHSPRQMKLANALCRYRELSRPVSL